MSFNPRAGRGGGSGGRGGFRGGPARGGRGGGGRGESDQLLKPQFLFNSNAFQYILLHPDEYFNYYFHEYI